MSTFCLLTGESQTGKSTLVNCIAGKIVAPIGNGNGYSVTQNTAVYDTSHQMQLMDSPGGLDTNLRTDDEIQREIEYAITKKSSKTCIDAILLTESLTCDTMQIQRNLQRLQTRFGAQVLQSIIVLGTKPSLSKLMFGDNRISAVSTQCTNFGAKFMTFETYSSYQNKTMVTGAALNDQIKALKSLMGQIRPYQMSTIAAIRKNLEDKAQRLMQAAPTQYQTKYYTESYSDPYTAQESYQVAEQYTENEAYEIKVPYQVTEHYTENVWDVVGKKQNVCKYGRKPKKQWGWVPVTRSRVVTKFRTQTATRPVTKNRTVTKYKNVTKYRNKTRQKSMSVAVPKDINVYRTQAMRQWENETKQRLKTSVSFV
eukprot:CAMPEP_0202726058 /NCGR_PEP_ID=MMETSP1385-20130828/184418_1 /ASSEMBLY_ACC=CAM_ASM_000861 /TAXON_ID=933848 /ORGANISM="Elphidium margaritaceum" /LENGTH=368 /DNA_ID=CAMNT_0049392271 /DNA_START=34 /DNA_END=1140 /DNA_ORIENTATION=+